MASELTRAVRLPRKQRRLQLLEAARSVFVAMGFHSASMDDIAARAGVTKPVLYQHFGSKRDLYLAVLDCEATSFLKFMSSALQSTKDNRARVATAVDCYLTFISHDDAAYRLFFESDLVAAPDVRERVERVDDECAGMVSQVIAQDTGLSDAEATLLANGLLGMAQSAARRWLRDREGIDKPTAVHLLTALAWRGISGFPRSHPPTGPGGEDQPAPRQ
ncbi:MAG: TetR/AcrR family transcriptional regulator [Candidatus Nanopelagicales bacterium]|nr:TetR/AcrR family transcriptional regulator [Candidatus Nanopelagicales bacterium]MDZ4248847.1 TetR/AcrR family transcriptional regulator [Candidatus Nanopelagicales bacterium]MDZ7578380.1 TetR/AcrR family transcriptional regulator [Candidatus Nanopelagicales bacterium]